MWSTHDPLRRLSYCTTFVMPVLAFDKVLRPVSSVLLAHTCGRWVWLPLWITVMVRLVLGDILCVV